MFDIENSSVPNASICDEQMRSDGGILCCRDHIYKSFRPCGEEDVLVGRPFE